MPFTEHECYAIPGYGGFVPQYKYKFGDTYGNTAREILKDLPIVRGQPPVNTRKPDPNENLREETARRMWKERGNEYAPGDDRLSFPPVPFYTGFIPRSEHYFGKPYVDTTRSALIDFHQDRVRDRTSLPLPLETARQSYLSSTGASGKTGGAARKSVTNAAKEAHAQVTYRFVSKPGAARLAETSANTDVSPYALPAQHPKKTFVSGYTGFVPRMQGQYGSGFSTACGRALDEFTGSERTQPNADRLLNPDTYRGTLEKQRLESYRPSPGHQRPIPGFTGHKPHKESYEGWVKPQHRVPVRVTPF